jgi:shikimate dehydrogenase
MTDFAQIPAHSGRSAVAGIMGWPVAHSQSPRLHAYWLNHYGIDGAYIPLPVMPDRLSDAINGLRAFGFRGANVTIPFKEAVIPLIDELTPVARLIGAVNTLIVDADGKITGTNTDSPGFLDNLRHGAPQWDARRPAAVIGAGGAARAVCAALLGAGVPEVRLFNRTFDKAETLAAHFRPYFKSPIRPLPLEEKVWEGSLAEVGVVVNTTSLGMTGHPPIALDLGLIPADAVVVDIVYNPLRTPFLAAAEARGLATVDGLGMLLFQARAGFQHWFGELPEVTDDLRAYVLQAMGA